MAEEQQTPKDKDLKPSAAAPKGSVPPNVKTAPNEDIQKELDEAALSTRRVRFLIINPHDFLLLFTKGLKLAKRIEVIDGVPEDARLQSMTVDHVRGGIILVVESDSYEPIPRTQMPPVQEVGIKFGLEGATKKKPTRRKK